MLYYGTVQLGTPGQELTVCPDTGSLAIWTAADTTPPTESGDSNFTRSYSSFVSNASSTFQVKDLPRGGPQHLAGWQQ